MTYEDAQRWASTENDRRAQSVTIHASTPEPIDLCTRCNHAVLVYELTALMPSGVMPVGRFKQCPCDIAAGIVRVWRDA
jgi:hypothetical protein